MSRSPIVLAVSVLLASSLLTTSAAAAQLDPRDEPSVSGPLTTSDDACERGVERRGGRVVLRVRLCYDLYLLDPGAETDSERDYGALWIQTSVNPSPGWCATEVRTSALVRPGGALVGFSPKKTRRSSTRARVTTRLKIDAGGQATEDAAISQRFTLYPRVLKPITSETSNGQRYTSRWRGNSGKKLAFAAGVEVAWTQGEGSPAITPSLKYRLVEKERCSAS
jgi:hypothetical protein